MPNPTTFRQVHLKIRADKYEYELGLNNVGDILSTNHGLLKYPNVKRQKTLLEVTSEIRADQIIGIFKFLTDN